MATDNSNAVSAVIDIYHVDMMYDENSDSDSSIQGSDSVESAGSVPDKEDDDMFCIINIFDLGLDEVDHEFYYEKCHFIRLRRARKPPLAPNRALTEQIL